jgi:translation initiation factor IF-1
MYDHLVAWQVDPAVELAFALKETECGHTGPGRPPQRNLHNIECNAFDGGSCRGPYHARFQSYPSYLHAVDAFARLLRTGRPYEPAGRYTVAQVLPIYAPPFENDTALYIAQVETWVAFWRSIDPSYRGEDVTTVSATPSPVPTTPVPVSAPPVDVTPCREARTTQATDLRAAPGGEVLRTLPAETPVRVRCQDQVTRTAAMDGRIWVQVQDDDSVLYPWIDVKDLEAIK